MFVSAIDNDVRTSEFVRRRFAAVTTYDLLVLTAGIWFLGKFLRYAFPPLFETLQGIYGVSNTVVGLAYTGLMGAYALTQFPSGVIADHIGSVRVLVWGVLITAVGGGLIAIDVGFGVIAGAMIIIGIGTGVHKTVAVGLLARAYPAQTGRVLGAFDTAGTYGGVVAPLAVTAVLAMPMLAVPVPGAPWRSVFVYGAVLGLVFGGGLVLRQVPTQEPETHQSQSPQSVGSYLRVFTDRRFSIFVIVTLLFGFAYNGLVAFLPLYLSNTAGLSTATAGVLYAVVFAVGAVQLVSGAVSDRFGRLPVIAGTLIIATLGLGGLVVVDTIGAIGAGIFIIAIGIGTHGFRPVRGAYLTEVLPETLAGGGLGAVRTLLMGAGAVAPGVIGVVADRAGFRWAFLLLTVLLAGAAVVAVGLLLTERSAQCSVS